MGLDNKSELTRLLQQIDRENEAAWQGLHGLNQGTAIHQFINTRVTRMADYHDALTQQVGAHKATEIIIDLLINLVESKEAQEGREKDAPGGSLYSSEYQRIDSGE